jgi:nitroreductase
MIPKAAVTGVDIHPLLRDRWSGRAFDRSRSIEPEKLQALAEAARWSPSSMNAQPWRFFPSLRNASASYPGVLEALSPSNHVWAKEAPLLLAVAANPCFADGKSNRWAQYDAGAAAMALVTEATSLDLMAHQMGGFDPAALHKALAIPEAWVPLTIIALGYQLPKDAVPESLAEREFAVRTRRAIEEIWITAPHNTP